MLPKGQDFFGLFELLFIAAVLANLVALGLACRHVAIALRASAVSGARRHRFRRARDVVRALAIADAAYLAIVFVVSLRSNAPVAAPHIGDPLCLAHRCIAVTDVARTR